MSTRGHIAHQINGRVRIDLAAHRGDTGYFSSLSERLAALDAVRHVRTNPLTGSVVLQFDGPLDDVLRRLDDIEIDEMPLAAAQRPPAAHASALPYRVVSGRHVHPMMLVGLAFGALGLVQAARGQVLVPALSAFWYAARAFRLAEAPALNKPDDTI